MDELKALGASLKKAREEQDLSLEELERRTRIRPKYLEAIEAGNFSAIRSPIQLKGFLRNYAYAVGLDADVVVAHYEQAASDEGQKSRRRFWPGGGSDDEEDETSEPLDLSAPPSSEMIRTQTSESRSTQVLYPTGEAAPPSQERSGTLRILRLLFIVGGAAILTAAIVGGVVIGINELTTNEEATPPPPLLEMNNGDTDSSGAVDLQSTVEPTETGIAIQPPETQNTPSFEGANQLFISLSAEERLWLRVLTDENIVFEGVLSPGMGVQYSATDSVTVRTSNAGGLNLRINNQPYRLGEGRVTAEQTFTLEGLVPPTQAPTTEPTSTNTATATFTLAASITATVTNTATEASASAADNAGEGIGAPTPTFFFTPLAEQTESGPPQGGPTPLPSPVQFTSTATVTSLPSPVPNSATPTPTASPMPSATYTPSITPSPTMTPTTPVTPTPFLPPRETRTPPPSK